MLARDVKQDNKLPVEDKPSPSEQRKRLSVEDWVLVAGISCLVIFLWIVTLFFVPLLTGRAGPVALPSVIVELAATRGFVLPPTWTPGPTPEFIPTSAATRVYGGLTPTRVYTPRATSLPGVPPLPLPAIVRPGDINVVDLARIMQGESPGDKEAAYYVGWVAKNRLLHAGYGDSYALVSGGFFGYRADLQPNEEFLKIALQVIRAREDPTKGSLYAFSRTDITKLDIPSHQADVTKGEWFFLKTWPL